MDRAHERLNQLLETHTTKPIDKKMAGAIDAVVTDFK
jgi:trimethylamine:corrinoid methyltransferase-like protein